MKNKNRKDKMPQKELTKFKPDLQTKLNKNMHMYR